MLLILINVDKSRGEEGSAKVDKKIPYCEYY